MKSPFPGMDPYIEVSDLWEDFHGHLIEKIFDEISVALPKGYVAQTSKRSYILLTQSGKKKKRSFIPDVKVTSPRPRGSGRWRENQRRRRPPRRERNRARCGPSLKRNSWSGSSTSTSSHRGNDS